jgi:hypothetical protein
MRHRRAGTARNRPERCGTPIRRQTKTGSAPGNTRHKPKHRGMRPTGFEPATFGLKDRRSLGPRKDPLTTELRALLRNDTRARGFEHPRRG